MSIIIPKMAERSNSGELEEAYHELKLIGFARGQVQMKNYQWWAGTQHGDFDSF